MIEILRSFFSRPESDTKDKVPEGVCPNCWGKQEYDNKFRKLYNEKQIDVNNHKAQRAFIQKFVVEHINGIKLRRGDSGLECPSCSFR
jgi:hypothetical protein